MQFFRFNSFDAKHASQAKDFQLEALKKRYDVQPYFKDARLLFYAASAAAYIFQAITAYLCFSALEAIFRGFGANSTVCMVFSILILCLSEIAKNKAFSKAAKRWFQFGKIDFAGVVVVVLFSGLTFYLSLRGVGAVVGEKATAQGEAIKSEYKAEKERIGKEIESLNKIALEARPKARKQALESIAALQAEREKLTTTAQGEAAAIGATAQGEAAQYKGFALVLDLLVFVCLIFVEYYYFKSYSEFAQYITEQPTEQRKNNDNIQGEAMQKKQPTEQKKGLIEIVEAARPPIGFGQNSTGQSGCKNCGKSFERKNKKHVFCSNECRIENWQNKTERSLPY